MIENSKNVMYITYSRVVCNVNVVHFGKAALKM